MTNRFYINDGWEFCEEFKEELISDDGNCEFTKVRIPHTTKYMPLNYCDERDYQMCCCYKYIYRYDKKTDGRHIIIHFEGAAHEAVVYVNSKEVLRHSCGYTAFEADITEYVGVGDNRIIVKLDSREGLNIPPFGKVVDYMTFGGIYRDVWIETRDESYIEDVFIYTDAINMIGNRANVVAKLRGHFVADSIRVKIKVGELRTLYKDVKLAMPEKLNKSDKVNNTEETLSKKGSNREILNKSDMREFVMKFTLKDVRLWDIEDPYLYDVKITVMAGDSVLDERLVRTGFRTAKWAEEGFFLNNRLVKIRGLNRHQSYPYVGYAMPDSMQILDADILKGELALNAVRTSHYPQSQAFIDRCDEIGLMVFTEIPGWQHIGDEAWKNQALINTKEMVDQYRNHPSVILWGVRINESEDDDKLYMATNRIARRLDPSRATGGVRCIKNSNLIEDVYTYNDFIHDGVAPATSKKRNVTKNTDKAFLISEYNGHMFPTKAFDHEAKQLEHTLRHARVLESVAKDKEIAGSFGWCMFDYNTHKDFGSGDRICYHGVCDAFRNPKKAASIYAAQGEETVLEVSSSMNIGEYAASCIGDIYAFTNADSVKLYRNDTFVAEFKSASDDAAFVKPVLIDDFIGDALVKEGMDEKQSDMIKQLIISYSRYGLSRMPAKDKVTALRLITEYHMNLQQGVDIFAKYYGNWGEETTAYRFDAIRNGKVVKSVIKEPFEKAQLMTNVSSTQLHEEKTYDVAEVRISMTDQNGNVLIFANEPVTVWTKGNIEVATSKGYTKDKHAIALSGGLGGVYVRTVGRRGKGTLYLESDKTGLTEIEFTVE